VLLRTIDTITEEEKRLFNPETTISEDTETIVVKIYRLDVESKKGNTHWFFGYADRRTHLICGLFPGHK
jgi:hypothetical protein